MVDVCFVTADFVARDMFLYYLLVIPVAVFLAVFILKRYRSTRSLFGATALLALSLGPAVLPLGHGAMIVPLWVASLCPFVLGPVLWISMAILGVAGFGVAVLLRWVVGAKTVS